MGLKVRNGAVGDFFWLPFKPIKGVLQTHCLPSAQPSNLCQPIQVEPSARSFGHRSLAAGPLVSCGWGKFYAAFGTFLGDVQPMEMRFVLTVKGPPREPQNWFPTSRPPFDFPFNVFS